MPVVVTLPAEIDFLNAAEVCDQICAAFQPGVAVVVADLTATTFCDTAGIRHLLLADERARAGQVEPRFVVPAAGSVQRVLGLTGVDRVLAVYRTLDGACCPELPAGITALPGDGIAHGLPAHAAGRRMTLGWSPARICSV